MIETITINSTRNNKEQNREEILYKTCEYIDTTNLIADLDKKVSICYSADKRELAKKEDGTILHDIPITQVYYETLMGKYINDVLYRREFLEKLNKVEKILQFPYLNNPYNT